MHIQEDSLDWTSRRFTPAQRTARFRAAYEARNAYALVPRRTRREELARQREPENIVLELGAFDEDED